MNLTKEQLWRRFQKYYRDYPELRLALDLSRMNFPENFFDSMCERMDKAFAAMADLEKGAIANPDERRMVGHYWLRNPVLAPTSTIRDQIEKTVEEIQEFAAQIHKGTIHAKGGNFRNILLIGIGGSALGPQFVSRALGHPATDKMQIFFFDNTDPDGMDLVLAQLGDELDRTLCVVISKSGSTKETRNGMIEAQIAFERAGLKFAEHAVAVTGVGSELDKHAIQYGWIARFQLWDWVGGRTSEMSAVGLLPGALQGHDVDSILRGARVCDEITRQPFIESNPAAQLALMWFYSVREKGKTDMVILPYKDRLEYLSKYLQQLIMESLGKGKDLNGNIVSEGIAVFGNKGSTDQHSYVQQLRDGLNNTFVTFIEVIRDRSGASAQVEPDVTSGDYLSGFLLGTRQALFENNRESISIAIDDVNPFMIGVLIALFERAVGFYASLINVNAYHQPGVEAGKKAAEHVIDLQKMTLAYLRQNSPSEFTCLEITNGLKLSDEVETVFRICERLSRIPERKIVRNRRNPIFESTYRSS